MISMSNVEHPRMSRAKYRRAVMSDLLTMSGFIMLALLSVLWHSWAIATFFVMPTVVAFSRLTNLMQCQLNFDQPSRIMWFDRLRMGVGITLMIAALAISVAVSHRGYIILTISYALLTAYLAAQVIRAARRYETYLDYNYRPSL